MKSVVIKKEPVMMCSLSLPLSGSVFVTSTKQYSLLATFDVLIVVLLKIQVFWDIMSYQLVSS
jgi:hypothetical protein